MVIMGSAAFALRNLLGAFRTVLIADSVLSYFYVVVRFDVDIPFDCSY